MICSVLSLHRNSNAAADFEITEIVVSENQHAISSLSDCFCSNIVIVFSFWYTELVILTFVIEYMELRIQEIIG